MLRCESLTKSYLSGGRELTVLKSITFALEPGGFLAIVGPSGSGKSTLLGLLAGLDQPTSGRVVLDGTDIAPLSEDDRARLRRDKVGFVFQSFHLIPTLTARENVQVPLELRGEEAKARAEILLGRVGREGRGHHYPAQLSGGEQQQVALARAFIHQPKLLFADELVTHDPDLAVRAHRVIRLRDGTNRPGLNPGSTYPRRTKARTGAIVRTPALESLQTGRPGGPAPRAGAALGPLCPWHASCLLPV